MCCRHFGSKGVNNKLLRTSRNLKKKKRKRRSRRPGQRSGGRGAVPLHKILHLPVKRHSTSQNAVFLAAGYPAGRPKVTGYRILQVMELEVVVASVFDDVGVEPGKLRILFPFVVPSNVGVMSLKSLSRVAAALSRWRFSGRPRTPRACDSSQV